MINPYKLRPFGRFCTSIGELPTSYLESMTYYEMLEWFCKYLEKTVIPAINNNAEALKEVQDKFIELKSYVDNYFDNLDVQEEINNKLDAMVEAGTMAEIINQEIFGELNDKIDAAQSEISQIKESNSFNELYLKRISRSLNKHSDDYANLQGCCYCKNNIIVKLCPSSTIENSFKVVKENIETGSIVNSNILQISGHGNWLSFNENLNELYCISENTIYVIDYNSLSLKDMISINHDESIYSFSYDKATNKYYFLDETLNLYEYNFTTEDFSLVCELDFKFTKELERLSNYTMQGANVFNNIIYLSSMNPYGLITFDLEGNIIQEYQYPYLVDDLYLLREVESVTPLENGDVYVITTGNESFNGEYQIHQYFKGNISHNVIQNHVQFNPLATRDIYVNGSSSNINPTGTQNNPFKTIGEALDCMNSLYYKGANINLSDGSYPHVYIFAPNKKIRINGNSNGNTIINGFRIFKSNVFIYNCKITNSYTGGSNIYTNETDLKLRSVNFTKSVSTNYIIESSSSNLDYGYIYKDGTEFDGLTNKDLIFANFGTTITCRALKSPLIVSNDATTVFLTPMKFVSDFRTYYGELNLPEEIGTLIKNKSVKKLLIEYTQSSSANDNSVCEVLNQGQTDTFKIGYSYLNSNSTIIGSAQLNVNADNTLSVSNSFYNVINTTGGSTIVNKTDNTAVANAIAITNILVM